MKAFEGLSVFIILFFASCGKDESLIPDVYVNVSLSYDIDLPRLRANGGVEIPERGKTAGIAGLVLYNNNGVILAYDRCSTVNPEKKCAVIYEGTASLVKDPCSGAYFDLKDGSPSKAPAERALKRYTVTVEGNNIRVIN
jgi:nitrite reductase/ring-hydroxylating ferredoxin subunit